MKYPKRALFGVLLSLSLLTGCVFKQEHPEFALPETIENVDDLHKLFPKTISDLASFSATAIRNLQKGIESIIEIPNKERTKENTLLAYDSIAGNFNKVIAILESLTFTIPEPSFKEKAEQELAKLKKIYIDMVEFNRDLFQALNYYSENNASSDSLNQQEQYLLDKVLKDYKRNGLELSEDKRKQMIQWQKEVAELSIEFQKNISDDKSTLKLSREQLAGLDDSFINALKKSDEGLYILGTDYPTYFTVMDKSTVADTRKAYNQLYLNRGYPANKEVLEKILALRDKIAKILGYKTYSDYALENQMVESSENATNFLNDLFAKAQKKENIEMALLKKNLPQSVTLTPDGKFYPWDMTHIISQYKLKNFNIDESKLAEYFPLDHTLEQLLKIYEQFLNIQFKEEKVSGFWHEDVRLISVYKDNKLIAYIFIDLHPRPGKYTHACQIGIIPAIQNKDGSRNVAVATVIANFPKAAADKPSLLKRIDVINFFHEFGHALHTALGATEMELLSGTNVKTDFVELPSQMLEKWISNKDILKILSRHYLTGEPLSDHMIDTLEEARTLVSGYYVLGQIWLAFLSLDAHKGMLKDIDELNKELSQKFNPHVFFDEDSHFYASFGHLTGYDAKYYAYLWSRVFALDLFYKIKEVGLLNPEIGTRYRDTILAPGGSKDPNNLLETFLGRKPNSDAFIKDLGF